MPAPLRLAFTHIPRSVWAGGYNYLNNLFAALDTHQHGKFAPVVFADSHAVPQELADLAQIPAVEVVQSSAFDRTSRHLAEAVFFGLDGDASREFSKSRIDVVIETARFFGWRLPQPSVGWFPDLQHRRLPHFFPLSARLRRELGFRMQILSGRTIMLSSEDARRDCNEMFPSLQERARVVRFATRPSAAALSAEPQQVIAQYGLPPCFFYLPNQFWRHKNHQVVIDALDTLATRGVEIVVAASGSTENPHDGNYFPDLMKEVERRGLQKNFRYLGMIPLTHVYALLRGCTALLNPSTFEGWSTTVEEAKSFGVPMMLSDIGVHREQTMGTAHYFGLNDATALADHLAASAAAFTPFAPRNLMPDVDQRVAQFAADFADTIMWTYERGRSRATSAL